MYRKMAYIDIYIYSSENRLKQIDTQKCRFIYLLNSLNSMELEGNKVRLWMLLSHFVYELKQLVI